MSRAFVAVDVRRLKLAGHSSDWEWLVFARARDRFRGFPWPQPRTFPDIQVNGSVVRIISMNEAVDVMPAGSVNGKKVGSPLILLRKHMKSPDVIATSFQDSALFEPQNHLAASWLSTRCDAELENLHDQVYVDANQEDQLIRDLIAAGFKVLKQRV